MTNKALEKLTAQIQKTYGNELVSFASDKTDRDITVHSTGSLMLDLAIGGSERAGIPEGRIMEVYGPESQGKCVAKDTYILTSKGYKTVEKILRENGTPAVNTTKVVEGRVPLVNRYGEIEETIGLTFNGKKPLLQITTNTGKREKVTFNHPLLALNERNKMVWKVASELKEGDVLIGRMGDMVFGDNDTLTEEDAYFLGLIVADSHFGSDLLTFTNDDNDILEFISNYCFSNYNVKPKSYKQKGENNSYDVHLGGKSFVAEIYEKFDIAPGVAKDKYVPNCIMEASKEIQLAFISGYLEVESYLGKDSFEVTSASERLGRELQLLLFNLGIVSYYTEKVVKGYEHNYYGRLTISGEFYSKLLEMLTFKSKKINDKKNERLSLDINPSSDYMLVPNLDIMLRDYIQTIAPDERYNKLNIDYIDKGHRTRRSKAIEILNMDFNGDKDLKSHIIKLIDEHYVYEPIVSIEELPPEPTFDVAMPRTHSFIGNGFINHNTTLCLLMIAARQREEDMKEEEDSSYQKKYCVFVDAEHALDFKLAEEYGVNLNELIYINPETAEQAMDVLDAYVRSGQIGLAVVDSVPALLPSSVEQSSFEQQHMAVLARFMSGVMQKITGPVFKNKVTLIFINQVREAIGKFSPVGTQQLI